MMRGGHFAGAGQRPHIFYRNGLWRAYTLIWDQHRRWTEGIRLGLGHTPDAAYNRWMDQPQIDSGRTLYTMKL